MSRKNYTVSETASVCICYWNVGRNGSPKTACFIASCLALAACILFLYDVKNVGIIVRRVSGSGSGRNVGNHTTPLPPWQHPFELFIYVLSFERFITHGLKQQFLALLSHRHEFVMVGTVERLEFGRHLFPHKMYSVAGQMAVASILRFDFLPRMRLGGL
jgi:hypothetical protein